MGDASEKRTEFKLPKLPVLKGNTNLENHLSTFQVLIELKKASEGLLCKVFPTTLQDGALKWFQGLELGSITSFMDLSTRFIAQYKHLIPKEVTSSDLFSVMQGENESMESYQARFKEFYERI